MGHNRPLTSIPRRTMHLPSLSTPRLLLRISRQQWLEAQT